MPFIDWSFETPKEFVGVWRQRNATYLSASIKYMGKRLEAAERSGGTAAHDAVLLEFVSAVRREGIGSVNDWFSSGDKEEVCKRVVSLIDTGAMDVNPKVPIYEELKSLADWAEEN